MSHQQFYEQCQREQEWEEAIAARVRELLAYDPATGEFVWRQRRQRIAPGDRAGGIDGKGYVHISIDGRLYRAHRLVWLYVHGHWPAHDIDHINGCRTDNRIANLRDVSRSINLQNKGCQSRSKTGVVGVSPSGGKFIARIKAPDTPTKYLGTFPNVAAAQEAYEVAKRDLHSLPF